MVSSSSKRSGQVLTGAGREATQLEHSRIDVLGKLVSADLVGEVRNPSSGEPSQQLAHGQRRPTGSLQLANQSAPHPTRIEIKLIK